MTEQAELGPALSAIFGSSAKFVRLLARRAGVDLSRQQWGLLETLDKYNRVVVPKAHSTGGTYSVAGYVLAQLEFHQQIKIVTTAPTWTGVELLLWGDIRKLVPLAAQAGFAFPEPNGTDLHIDVSRWAEGLSTNDVHRIAGHHESEVRIIIDEAPGVRSEVWSGVDGLRASGNVKIVALGQPLSPSGEFYDACKPGSGWHKYRMDAFESPNLSGLTVEQLGAMPLPTIDQPDVAGVDLIRHPHLVRRRWVRELWDKVQRDDTHPHWMGKARAEFPTENEYTLYPLTQLERANVKALDAGDQVMAGVDVAGPGKNETVAIVVCGDAVLALGAWVGKDSRGDVLQFLAPWRGRIRRPLNVDQPGMGYYFIQHLKDNGWRVNGVNTGLPARNGKRFHLVRDEILWHVRERLMAGAITGLTDEPLRAQMAPLQWAPDPKGLTRVEQKGKRPGLEWDRIDTLALAMAGSAVGAGDSRTIAPEDIWGPA